jgi:hypothetical protein
MAATTVTNRQERFDRNNRSIANLLVPAIIGVVAFLCALAIYRLNIWMFGGVGWQLSKQDAKEYAEIAKNCVEITAFAAGTVYFVWRLFFQKEFQQLSVDFQLRPLELTSPEGPLYVLDCKISNRANARINLDSLQYALTCEDQKYKDFDHNLTTGNGKCYSIDAHSTVHFRKKVTLPEADVICAEVTFRPKMTNDIYHARRIIRARPKTEPNTKKGPANH